MGVCQLGLLLLCVSGTLDDNRAFQEGVGLYQELEYEQAIFRFEEAALNPELTPSERAMVFGWMAMAYAGRGDAEATKRSLRNALTKDPELVLPPVAPPKVKAWLDEVRAEQPRRAAATTEASEEAPTEGAAPTSGPTRSPRAGAGDDEDGDDSGDERAHAAARSPVSSVEEFVITPEEPEGASSSGVLISLLMMGTGAGAMVLGAVLGVPAALFFFDYYVVTQQYLPQIDGELESGMLSPAQVDSRMERRAQYEEAANLDLIGGAAFLVPGAVVVLAGVALVLAGAGTGAWAAME